MQITTLIYVVRDSFCLCCQNAELLLQLIFKFFLSFLEELATFVIPYQSDPNNFIVTLRKDVCKLNFTTGETTRLGTVEPNTTARFNDGKCDAKGRLWTGNLAKT